MRGEHALGVGVADLHRGGVALRFHEIDEPVHGGGAVVDPLVPLLLVHAIAVARQLLADVAVDGVLRVIGDAQTLVEFRPDAVVGAAARYRLGAGGEQDHVGAFFRCRCCAGQTRNACTHDDDVGLVGLRDLAVGHGLGRDLERPGSLLMVSAVSCPAVSEAADALEDAPPLAPPPFAAQPASPNAAVPAPASIAPLRKLRRSNAVPLVIIRSSLP